MAVVAPVAVNDIEQRDQVALLLGPGPVQVELVEPAVARISFSDVNKFVLPSQ